MENSFWIPFFIKLTPLTSGRCPEDFHELPKFVCTPDPSQCITDYEDHGQWRQPKILNNLNTENGSSTYVEM